MVEHKKKSPNKSQILNNHKNKPNPINHLINKTKLLSVTVFKDSRTYYLVKLK